MLIRIAVAVCNKTLAQKLTNRIVSFSMRHSGSEEDIEFDFSFYDNLTKLLKNSRNKDKILQYEYALFRLADYYIAHPEIKPCSLLSLLEDVLEEPLAVKQKRFCGAGESMCFFDMEGTA